MCVFLGFGGLTGGIFSSRFSNSSIVLKAMKHIWNRLGGKYNFYFYSPSKIILCDNLNMRIIDKTFFLEIRGKNGFSKHRTHTHTHITLSVGKTVQFQFYNIGSLFPPPPPVCVCVCVCTHSY